jgi:hypothetical protein
VYDCGGTGSGLDSGLPWGGCCGAEYTGGGFEGRPVGVGGLNAAVPVFGAERELGAGY